MRRMRREFYEQSFDDCATQTVREKKKYDNLLEPKAAKSWKIIQNGHAKIIALQRKN